MNGDAWQISSDDDLLIVCTPGGSQTIWYPEPPLGYSPALG